MFRFIPRIAAVLLVVVAATLAPAAAEERQLTGSGAGFVLGGSLQGGGQATHLGRSALYVPLYTDFLGSGLFLPFGGSLEAANGDALYFVFDEEAYYFDPAIGVVSTTVTFTGGTGRFKDVTGSAVVMVDFTPDFYHFEFLIDGTIDY